ncbi:MAG: J domain-containing protein [Acidobacteria bacterium]|nr:J domain-containing protein [Acidobacteriota bacterium]
MGTTYYDLLGVPASASADEIKKAFRHEIAKYHPDKVQHLGSEFQQIAAAKSADLTRAYKTLTDAALRADYDGTLRQDAPAGQGVPPSSYAPPPAEPSAPRPTPEPPPAPRSAPRRAGSTQDRTGVSDLVRRAAVVRFRQAAQAEFGMCEDAPVPGFEVACTPPKARLWSKIPPRMFAKFVVSVDAAAVAESWALAVRARKKDDDRALCVFLMGPDVAPAGDLARAIAEERRRPTPPGLKLTLVPVNTRSWIAHIPQDAPPAVKALLDRLKP